MLGRMLAALGAFVGLATGAGTGAAWLAKHTDGTTLGLVGLGIFALFVVVLAILAQRSEVVGGIAPVLVLIIAGVQTAGLMAATGLPNGDPEDYAQAAVVGLCLAGGIVLAVWWVDVRSHKTCPDCAERVKLEARVCRYCRHAFGSGAERDADAVLHSPLGW
ncbi:hypothetical protein FSW04_01330 [Baekduia soli]|uniref:Zinc ribbon domain-containing protein n=1 Tax=Baekduia soli TaxID=496014 RepID=A0A5B8U063_9ACTN|nr:hypothetical protein [Baekduia soli]QEC46350.1 hypothetical protein FSW04_01330 [Baekduia soli]